jgi:hypothetical protein
MTTFAFQFRLSRAEEKMTDQMEFVRHYVPGRIADLGFRIDVPQDWQIPELPAEDVDFSDPTRFVPLMLAVAPYAAIVLTVCARPAYENGAVSDWASYLLAINKIEESNFETRTVGQLNALTALGRQEQDGTLLETRFAFIEDGGRFLNLSLMAPAMLASSLEGVWTAALESFELESPKGQNALVIA